MSLDKVTEGMKETPNNQQVVTEDVKIENLLILKTIGTGAEILYNKLLK